MDNDLAAEWSIRLGEGTDGENRGQKDGIESSLNELVKSDVDNSLDESLLVVLDNSLDESVE
jgi:hypothetical protein